MSSFLPESPDMHPHWRQLAVLLRSSPEHGRQLLRTPAPGSFPDQETLETLMATARCAGLDALFQKHLLSGLVRAPGEERLKLKARVGSLCSGCIDELVPASLLSRPWISVPVPVSRAGWAGVVWFCLCRTGEETDFSPAGRPVPDDQTLKAMRLALDVGDPRSGHHLWSLQADEEVPVTGGSLGLPVFLGARFLAENAAWPSGLFASGVIGRDGVIGAVANLPEKYRYARARLFLAPAENGAEIIKQKNVIACAEAEDAWFAAELLAGGIQPGRISRYQSCRHDPGELLARFHCLPLPFLLNKETCLLLEQVRQQPVVHLKQLAECLRRCGFDPARGSLAAGLFSPGEIGALVRAPGNPPDFVFALFDWCLAVMAFADHQGRTGESAAWGRVAARMMDMVEPGERAELANRLMVSGRFNTYDFRPELPDLFRRALELEERHYEDYPHSSHTLGAMYGTLAQNCGFCGPDFLEQLLGAADRSQKAFGRKNCREAGRLDNYRIYGLLDAGRTDEAASLLSGYFGLDGERDADALWRTACAMAADGTTEDVFRAALGFRFLADTGFRVSGPRNLPVHYALEGAGHPWQLLSRNLGRILLASGRHSEAERMFRRSVGICLAGGETMRAMALCSLAELHAAGMAGDADYEQAAATVRWIAEDSHLNREHFSRLYGVPGREIPGLVFRCGNELFPFSYR